jgi:serine/threonine protein kinase
MVNEGHNIYTGNRIKSYTIQEKLGSGGSACVYLSQNNLREYAAIKILNPDYVKTEGQRLFRQEAQILQELKYHQYILPFIDYGQSDGTPYIITEYNPGGTLRTWINTSPHAGIEKILSILLQISQAIYAAHLHNIVHNDLKPENILFNKKGEAVLADFGISARLGRRKKIFRRPRGTYAYMAPEQFDGIYAKEGDQYSLGCIAYELLTGRHPFESLSQFNPYDLEIMQDRHKSIKPLPPREFNSSIPAHIERAILTSMAKLPSERHTSIAAFISSLQPSLLVLPQPFYHFTYPLDTPPPYTPSHAESPVPTISPECTASAILPDQEVCERVHMQAYSHSVLRYPNYRYPPRQTIPKNIEGENIEGEQLKHTDPGYFSDATGKLAPKTNGGTRKARPNPLQTKDLQLLPEFEALLSQPLGNLGLKLCPKLKQHPFTPDDWTCTAIVANKPDSHLSQDDFVPQYSIIYLPGNFLTTSKYINHVTTIFALFTEEVLIIFSDTSKDLDPYVEQLIDYVRNYGKLTISIVKQGHIKELNNIKNNIAREESWIKKHLKSEFFPLGARKVEPADIGTLEALTVEFLKNTPDIRKHLGDFGSTDLQQVLLTNEITRNKTLDIVAHNIIKRLNEPPYHPSSTGHTLLGEFLCLILQKRNFRSRLSNDAQKIKDVIRKYRLGPLTCPHCND